MGLTTRVARAVAECTQPFAHKHPRKLQALEGAVEDPWSRNDVYQDVAARVKASLDQHLVLQNCFAIFRRFLLRYPPDEVTGAQIANCCLVALSQLDDSSSELWQCVNFVHDLVRAVTNMGIRGSRPALEGDARQPDSVWRRGGSRSTRAASDMLSRATLQTHDSPRSTTHDIAVKSDVVAEPSDDGSPREWQRYPSMSGQQPAISTPYLPLPAETALSVTKASVLRGTILEDLFAARWQLDRLPPGYEALGSWPLQLPHSGLRLFASMSEAREAHEAGPQWKGLRGDYKCASDSNVGVQVFAQGKEHLRRVAQMQRLMAAGRSEDGTKKNGSSHPSLERPMFAYQRYCQQEKLEMSDTEVAAVVGVVLGPEAASGLLGASYDALLASDDVAAGGRPSKTSVPVDRAASILVKLIIDMWLATDATESWLLHHAMLQAGLQQDDAELQQRVFDLLYNLSLHAHMIDTDAPVAGAGGPAEFFGPGAAGGAGGGSGQGPMQPRVMASHNPGMHADGDLLFGPGSMGQVAAPMSPLPPARPPLGLLGGALQAPAPLPNISTRANLFVQWLRCLLFELLLTLSKMDVPERVWRAAAGCLVHLVSQHGTVHTSVLGGLSNAVVARMLAVARHHSWSLELQSILIGLACHLCYVHMEPEEGGAPPEAGSSPHASEMQPPLNISAVAAFGGFKALGQCLLQPTSARARACLVGTLLDIARESALAMEDSFRLYHQSHEYLWLKALLTNHMAMDVLALALSCNAATMLGAVSDAVQRHLAATGWSNREHLVEAARALHVLLTELQRMVAPTGARGGSGWDTASLSRAVLSDEETRHAEVLRYIEGELDGQHPRQQAHAISALCTLLFDLRIDAICRAISELYMHRMPPNATALDAMSILPSPDSWQTADSPLVRQAMQLLVARLQTPALPSGQADLLIQLYHVLTATLVVRKSELHATGPVAAGLRTNVQHLAVLVATLQSAVRWAARLQPQARVQAMLALTDAMLQAVSVPMHVHSGGGVDLPPGTLAAADSAEAKCSTVSLFLRGTITVPSVAVALIPTQALLTLQSGLLPQQPASGAPPPRGSDTTDAGFVGNAALEVSVDTKDAAGAAAGASVPLAVLMDADELGLPEGLTTGHASVCDARLAIQLVLMWKWRMDETSLAAAGGSKQQKKLLDDDDARMRFVVADFLLNRATRHKEAEFRNALQRLVTTAPNSSIGTFVENPYVQLQAFLFNDLLSIDDL